MVTAKEQEARDRFANRYREERVDVVRAIERRVIGGDWGANGYTTIEQADDLAHRLHLSRGDLLLDVGAGRGWPGLYLAAITGCSVVLADVPLEGLAVAAARVRTEHLEERRGASTPAPAISRSGPHTSMPSSTPTCCVDCAPSSP